MYDGSLLVYEWNEPLHHHALAFGARLHRRVSVDLKVLRPQLEDLVSLFTGILSFVSGLVATPAEFHGTSLDLAVMMSVCITGINPRNTRGINHRNC